MLDELADSPYSPCGSAKMPARALLCRAVAAGKRAPFVAASGCAAATCSKSPGEHADFPIVVETFRECLHDHLDLDRLQNCSPTSPPADGGEDTAAGNTIAVRVRPSVFFTAAYSTSTTRRTSRTIRPLGSATARSTRRAAKRAICSTRGQSIRSKRGLRSLGRCRRALAEDGGMAAPPGRPDLRRIGRADGRFFAGIADGGRALRISVPALPRAAALDTRRGGNALSAGFRANAGRARKRRRQRERRLHRFLATHALVGLAELLDRYPFEPDLGGTAIEGVGAGGPGGASATRRSRDDAVVGPENLDRVQRGSLAISREVVTCAPPQFADFLLRWQGLHPDTRRGRARA